MLDLTPLLWLLALVVTAGAAAIQGTVGVGYGLVAVPILALIDPRLSPVPQLLTVIPLTVAMFWSERHAIDLTGMWWLIAGRVPGAVLGVLVLAWSTQGTIDLFIGLTVIAAVLALVAGLHVEPTPLTQLGAGIASGVTGLVAGIGGPPVALLYANREAPTLRATLAAVFTFGVTVSLAGRAFSGNIEATDFSTAAVLVPAVAVGWLISRTNRHRLSNRSVRIGVLVVSGLAALGLVIRSLG